MANMILADGVKYINGDVLIEKMTENAVKYTDPNDLEVMEDEARMVNAYQKLLKDLGYNSLVEKFRKRYVEERFIKRTIGV